MKTIDHFYSQETENRTPQTETPSVAEQIAEVQGHLQSLSGIFDKTPYRLSGQYRRCQVEIEALSRILECCKAKKKPVRMVYPLLLFALRGR